MKITPKYPLICLALMTALPSYAGPLGNLNSTNRTANFRDSLRRPPASQTQKPTEPTSVPTPPVSATKKSAEVKRLEGLRATKQGQLDGAIDSGDKGKQKSLNGEIKVLNQQLDQLR